MMDSQSSPPIQGKTHAPKPKAVQKPNANEPQLSRQKRVFGTVKNQNIPAKIVHDNNKPIIKLSIQEKKTVGPKEKPKTIPKKKQLEDNIIISEPQTPRSCNKGRVISTPYHSAVNCSKCRFDRLETASYWVGHIKLAESVSKHFVSASFFRLAIESKAEPKVNLRNELKRYLVRHDHLRKETEWKQVCFAYGLLKDESSHAQSEIEACDASKNIYIDLEQEHMK